MKIDMIDELVKELRKRSSGVDTPYLIALDGRSGSGKTSLSVRLGQKLGASVILGDNFYSGGQLDEWAVKSPQEKVDYCMDWHRMRKEALEPLLAGHHAKWRTFNWDKGFGLSEEYIECPPAPIIILDGTFSGRKELSDIVDTSVLMNIPEGIRRQRLNDREGQKFMDEWHAVWAECEDLYFTKIKTPRDFDIIIDSLKIESKS